MYMQHDSKYNRQTDFAHARVLRPAIREALNLLYSTGLNETIYVLVEKRVALGQSVNAACKEVAADVLHGMTGEEIRLRYYRAAKDRQPDDL